MKTPKYDELNGDDLAVSYMGRARPNPADFLFAIVSARRPQNVKVMAAVFEGTDVVPVWFVANEDEVAAYRAQGALEVRVGGGLCEARNAALDLAKQQLKFCVQLSDDVHGFGLMDAATDCFDWSQTAGSGQKKRAGSWTKPVTITASNKIAARATCCKVSAVVV